MILPDEPAPLYLPDVAGLTLMEAALAFAEAGWYVLPVEPGSKNPGSVVGGKWHELSTRNANQIRHWWTQNPNYGIALHCGRSLAIVFDLDVDSLNAVRSDIADALSSAGAIQGTRRDGDRGHYIYLMPEGEQFGNGAGAFIRWGEVRGKNGVIIAAPTPHPDAETKGGHYHQRKTGVIGPLPDVLRECLTEAGETAEPLTTAELDEFLNAYNGGGCGRENCAHEVCGPVKRFNADVDEGASRHESMVAILPWALSEAMAGCYPAREVFDALSGAFATAKPEADSGEFLRMVAWAAAQANPERAHRNDELPTDDEMEAFWAARPVLTHIYSSSLAQQMDPRGVLAVHLARAIVSIPPYVTIPAVTAARSSLNLHVALVGPSSSGKSSAVGVAKRAIPITPEPEVTSLGSGEGIAKQYAYRDTKTKVVVTMTDTLLFNDTEVESVEALSKRAGNPLMSQWRKTFTGEQLGFGYADPKNRIPIREQKYRFCQILGIQPELAAWLLDGTQASAGTPQRMLWAPVVYPKMPRPEDLPEWPEPMVLPRWPEPEDNEPKTDGTKMKWKMYRGAVDQAAGENFLQENELSVPPEVAQLVRETRWKLHLGEVDGFKAHGMLTRLKVAAGLMWLDGRTEMITDEDWDLAGVVMAVSNATRDDVHAALHTKAGRENIRRGRAEGERELAKEEMLRENKIARVAEGIREKLRAENHQKVNRLAKRFRGPNRQYVWPALELLQMVGDVELEPIEYQGNPGHVAHLKEGR
jgi:hypothetical protein